VIDRAGPADLERLATLHLACLPDSLLSSLGRRAVVRYYEYASTAATELVLAARVDGGIGGGCVLSRAPATLLRRFAAASPVRLVGELGRELIRSRGLRSRFFHRVRERDSDALLDAPEIVQIFTAEELRGRGIGSQLLRSCEESLRREGATAYTIRTHRDDNDAGLRFYRREGFAPIGETVSFGDRFVVMKKDLR
jgi:GNAT superfamily N-acetyltransferase